MAREMFMDFVKAHQASYTAIGKACKRWNVNVDLGECPNQIIVMGEIPAGFRNYMRRNQRDFVVMEG